jgi:hypothetical protein
MPFQTDKFPRIAHFPFSPGAKNDDRIAEKGWFDFIKKQNLVFTEKLDGENTCLKKDGVFARTHAVPNHNPWATYLWPIYDTISSDLGDLEIFGENMFAVHSIEYERLDSYFYVFGVRENGIWKSAEDAEFIAEYFGLKSAYQYANPFLSKELDVKSLTEGKLELVIKRMATQSHFGDTCEGIVVRVADEFLDVGDSTMGFNVLKYVRKNHVQTDEHWTKHWKKAKLISER